MSKIAKKLTDLIGNTPLLELGTYRDENKLEANLIAVSIIAFATLSFTLPSGLKYSSFAIKFASNLFSSL